MSEQQTGESTPLLFPALIRLDDKLLCTGSEITRYWNFKHHEKNIFSVTEPVRIKKAFLWMIDAEGKFREFREISRHRKTPNLLKRIYNFTRIRYEITEPRVITAGEIRQILKGSRGHRKGFLQAISDLEAEDELSPKLFLHDFMKEPEDVAFSTFPKQRKIRSNQSSHTTPASAPR